MDKTKLILNIETRKSTPNIAIITIVNQPDWIERGNFQYLDPSGSVLIKSTCYPQFNLNASPGMSTLNLRGDDPNKDDNALVVAMLNESDLNDILDLITFAVQCCNARHAPSEAKLEADFDEWVLEEIQ